MCWWRGASRRALRAPYFYFCTKVHRENHPFSLCFTSAGVDSNFTLINRTAAPLIHTHTDTHTHDDWRQQLWLQMLINFLINHNLTQTKAALFEDCYFYGKTDSTLSVNEASLKKIKAQIRPKKIYCSSRRSSPLLRRRSSDPCYQQFSGNTSQKVQRRTRLIWISEESTLKDMWCETWFIFSTKEWLVFNVYFSSYHFRFSSTSCFFFLAKQVKYDAHKHV